MVRAVAHKMNGYQCAKLLMEHQVPERFAKSVGKMFDEKGAGAAMVRLYAGGWEISTMVINGQQKLYIGRRIGMTDKQLNLILKGDNGGTSEDQKTW